VGTGTESPGYRSRPAIPARRFLVREGAVGRAASKEPGERTTRPPTLPAASPVRVTGLPGWVTDRYVRDDHSNQSGPRRDWHPDRGPHQAGRQPLPPWLTRSLTRPRAPTPDLPPRVCSTYAPDSPATSRGWPTPLPNGAAAPSRSASPPTSCPWPTGPPSASPPCAGTSPRARS